MAINQRNRALPRYLPQEEVKRLLARVRDRRDRAIFALISHYGLRVTEATLLQTTDVDFTRNTIAIPRVNNGLGGFKPLWQDTRRLLRAYLRVRIP